jgi:hypothetical protein
MGFLFDEDMVASGGPTARVRAIRHWQELVGDYPDADEFTDSQAPIDESAEMDAGPLLEAEGEFIEGDEELLLDDLIPGASGDDDDLELTLDDSDIIDSADDFASEIDADLGTRIEDAMPGETIAAQEPPAKPPLSKFRVPPKKKANEPRVVRSGVPVGIVEVDDANATNQPGPSELGRIPIVRVRLEGNRDRPSLLTRLLTSF